MTTTVPGLAGLTGLAGMDLGRTAWVRLTPDLVRGFGVATANPASSHSPDADAHDGPYGFAVVDGFHTLALAGMLFDRLLEVRDIRMTVIYGVNKLRFPAPVPVGGQVRLAAAIGTVESMGGGCVQLVADCAMEMPEAEKPACAGSIVYRFYA
ncbi:MaoC/PaaZ C-terminal domain-containing protein [Amycolatopsis saalfeldensis]|uniref:Acyl dehydratase n=1 Tax=Amycolatopsis saalfeldensis TaxID=394193 RepID=A0A1H8YJS5_9PSEU|nr:MaoC/PaaZ C-terminal domain-containing protein [Amycolatopsis saalfeldensis]SEP52397.1 Acyl dehydratase [Amycolatopsis saalfeldensis]